MLIILRTSRLGRRNTSVSMITSDVVVRDVGLDMSFETRGGAVSLEVAVFQGPCLEPRPRLDTPTVLEGNC
jgi:hypothetical protein